ncbi:MAG: DMT family transporter [Granulosicoccus sp.]
MTTAALQIRSPSWFDHGRLLLVSAIWGSAFLNNAIALQDFAPISIAAFRITMAAVIMLIICWGRSLFLRLDSRRISLLAGVGMLNSAMPFTLIGWGQQTVDPAVTGILLAASPFAALLFAHYMTRDDRFSFNKLVGLLVGFAGVTVLLGQGLFYDSTALPGMLAIISAAVCYAYSAALIRKLGGMSSLLVVAISLSFAAVLLLPVALWRHPPSQQVVHTDSLLALGFLALGPTAFAYVLRTQIVQQNGVVFMSGAGYLIPLFAVLWTWMFLGQVPTLHALLALVLILAGSAIGQRRS